MNMDCLHVQRLIWAGDVAGSAAAHVESCRACSVEARRAEQLSSTLASFSGELAVPPDGLEAALLARLPRSARERARRAVGHPKFWRGAALGAAAATAAAFGLVVARRMVRPDLVG